jgi:hypothetical protein
MIPHLYDKNLVELRIEQYIKTKKEVEVIKKLFKENIKIRGIELKFKSRDDLYDCFVCLRDNFVIKTAIFLCRYGIDNGRLSKLYSGH